MKTHSLLICTLVLWAVVGPAVAAVRLPAIFGDHMVLQCGMKVPVWGWAEPGEKVTVTAGQSSASAVADAQGKWRAFLPPMAASEQSIELTVSGSNSIVVRDVLVGEVWVCSGQSNMEFRLGTVKGMPGPASNAAEEIPKADHPLLRLFLMPYRISFTPQDDCTGKWTLCTPETAASFSAVGYFFGRDLLDQRKTPVGMIGDFWGATPAQAWTSLDALRNLPEASEHVRTFETVRDTPPAARKKYDQHLPTGLFNGMVSPIIGFGMRGVIWYQGEGNAANPDQYRALFPAMIQDWRARWGQGDFPFLWVQLANFTQNKSDWARLREAQTATLSLHNTAQALAIDIGDANNIHPADKIDVARRLLLVARHVAYGEQLVYSGPTYDSHTVVGHAIRVRFKNVGAGLTVAAGPATRPSEPVRGTRALEGFQVAGADQVFVPAEGVIDGDLVVVSSPRVDEPVAVRSGWANNPHVNLYNGEGLPAVPFRTDTWNSGGAVFIEH